MNRWLDSTPDARGVGRFTKLAGTWLLRTLRQAALGAAVLAAGLGAASAETVLRIVPHADLKNLDPIWTTAYITRNHGYMVYDTLFAVDENLKVQPQMVDTWSASDDGLKYTFTLRDGLKWHDGQPVTAEDCVASIQRWASVTAWARS